jgi:hypothetical protein
MCLVDHEDVECTYQWFRLLEASVWTKKATQDDK